MLDSFYAEADETRRKWKETSKKILPPSKSKTDQTVALHLQTFSIKFRRTHPSHMLRFTIVPCNCFMVTDLLESTNRLCFRSKTLF